MGGYSRGYTVSSRGAWASWVCDREGCGATGTGRGEEPADRAAWAAAAHQQEAHHQAVADEATRALTDAADLLRASSSSLTDVDVRTHRGTACVTPQAAWDALSLWAVQLRSQQPEPGDKDARYGWRLDQSLARQGICTHEPAPPRPQPTSKPSPIAAAAAPITEALIAVGELPVNVFSADVLISYTHTGCVVRVADHRANHRAEVEQEFRAAFTAAGWSVTKTFGEGAGLGFRLPPADADRTGQRPDSGFVPGVNATAPGV
ncbi:hypothetical protein ACIO3O_41720 [Streptomyces sp. NPDC087440]|uniref:hypothetical protein n=1 Tax=Streptomyces sp. NPDC087440 TaxID=3365790 RepID=UPI00382878B6